MLHRHLDNPGFSLPAIDDIILHGAWKDWIDLRRAILLDPSLMDKVGRICRANISDPYAQRYYFWLRYVEKKRNST